MTAVQNDIIEVAAIHVNDGVDEQINVFQFRKTDVLPTTDADLLDDVATVMETLYNLVKTIITVRNVLSDVVVRNLTQGLLVGSTNAGTYTGGSGLGDSWPNGAAAMSFFKTNVPRVILKKYWPSGIATTLSPGGNPDSSWLAALALVSAELLVPFGELNTTLEYGYDSPKTLSWEVPLTGHVPAIMSYQRRRKAGVGS